LLSNSVKSTMSRQIVANSHFLLSKIVKLAPFAVK